jgi:hypothetical protein
MSVTRLYTPKRIVSQKPICRKFLHLCFVFIVLASNQTKAGDSELAIWKASLVFGCSSPDSTMKWYGPPGRGKSLTESGVTLTYIAEQIEGKTHTKKYEYVVLTYELDTTEKKHKLKSAKFVFENDIDSISLRALYSYANKWGKFVSRSGAAKFYDDPISKKRVITPRGAQSKRGFVEASWSSNEASILVNMSVSPKCYPNYDE